MARSIRAHASTQTMIKAGAATSKMFSTTKRRIQRGGAIDGVDTEGVSYGLATQRNRLMRCRFQSGNLLFYATYPLPARPVGWQLRLA